VGGEEEARSGVPPPLLAEKASATGREITLSLNMSESMKVMVVCSSPEPCVRTKRLIKQMKAAGHEVLIHHPGENSGLILQAPVFDGVSPLPREFWENDVRIK
jgi:predicted CoA-binding protein